MSKNKNTIQLSPTYKGEAYLTEQDLLDQGYINPKMHPAFEGNVKNRVDEAEQKAQEVAAVKAARDEAGYTEKYGDLDVIQGIHNAAESIRMKQGLPSEVDIRTGVVLTVDEIGDHQDTTT